ncbi:MFS transporter prlL [Fusarium oxysporum f. sp. albedinis]|nr:MFS transporter prlL [Fusarium oxysporum f. sp. albedinis]
MKVIILSKRFDLNVPNILTWYHETKLKRHVTYHRIAPFMASSLAGSTSAQLFISPAQPASALITSLAKRQPSAALCSHFWALNL